MHVWALGLSCEAPAALRPPPFVAHPPTRWPKTALAQTSQALAQREKRAKFWALQRRKVWCRGEVQTTPTARTTVGQMGWPRVGHNLWLGLSSTFSHHGPLRFLSGLTTLGFSLLDRSASVSSHCVSVSSIQVQETSKSSTASWRPWLKPHIYLHLQPDSWEGWTWHAHATLPKCNSLTVRQTCIGCIEQTDTTITCEKLVPVEALEVTRKNFRTQNLHVLVRQEIDEHVETIVHSHNLRASNVATLTLRGWDGCAALWMYHLQP